MRVQKLLDKINKNGIEEETSALIYINNESLVDQWFMKSMKHKLC